MTNKVQHYTLKVVTRNYNDEEPFPKYNIKFDSFYNQYVISTTGRWGSHLVTESCPSWDEELKSKVKYDIKYDGTEWEMPIRYHFVDMKDWKTSNAKKQYDQIKAKLTNKKKIKFNVVN